jgi:MFS family permease
MIIGSAMLIGVHVMFALPVLNYWWFAAFIAIVLGVAFSLVPSAMWPSVPKIIPEKLLGSAYALIFWVQNIGLGFVPLLIGWLLNEYCIVGERVVDGQVFKQYDYTLPMCVFACFGIVALLLRSLAVALHERLVAMVCQLGLMCCLGSLSLDCRLLLLG